MKKFLNSYKTRFFFSSLIVSLLFSQGFSFKGFAFPKDLDQKYIQEMDRNASREEKRERAIILLKRDIPLIHIAPIVHMSKLYIKKIAEGEGIKFLKKN